MFGSCRAPKPPYSPWPKLGDRVFFSGMSSGEPRFGEIDKILKTDRSTFYHLDPPSLAFRDGWVERAHFQACDYHLVKSIEEKE